MWSTGFNHERSIRKKSDQSPLDLAKWRALMIWEEQFHWKVGEEARPLEMIWRINGGEDLRISRLDNLVEEKQKNKVIAGGAC